MLNRSLFFEMPDPLTVSSIRGGVVEAIGAADRNTYTVSGAGTASGGRFVDAVTPGSFLVNVSGATSMVCIGLAIHDAAANGKVTVAHHGIWYVRASGAITAGQRLITGAAGVAVAAGAAPDARSVVAIAQEDITTGTDGRAKLVI